MDEIRSHFVDAAGDQAHYWFGAGSIRLAEVFVDHASLTVSVSAPGTMTATHMTPLRAEWTQSPSTRPGYENANGRVSGMSVDNALIPVLPAVGFALLTGESVGPVAKLGTDAELEELLEG